MPFERFTATGKSFAPRASISTSGLLTFNDGARHRFHLEDASHAVLYFDADTKRIGVQLTSDETDEGARKLRIRESGAIVSVKALLDYYDVHISATTVYAVDRDVESGMLVVDLSKGQERGRTRGRARQVQSRRAGGSNEPGLDFGAIRT